MAQKSMPEKLGIKAGNAVWLSDAARSDLVGPLPEGGRIVPELADAAVAVVFAESGGALRELLEAERANLRAPGVLWVAYPKGGRADINRDTLWPILAEHGLRPVSQVALDETWSALRFRPLKAGEGFPGGRG